MGTLQLTLTKLQQICIRSFDTGGIRDTLFHRVEFLHYLNVLMEIQVKQGRTKKRALL